jgi:hypothetical protein
MATESADSFIERYHTTLTKIRLSERVNVELSAADGGSAISLDKIESHEPGKGHAKFAMKALMSIADDMEFDVKVVPTPLDESTDKERLVKWYERCGFTPAGDGKTLVRKVLWSRNG